MNPRRIANLLRELADALDEPAAPAKPKRRPLTVVPPGPLPKPETMAKVQRSLRRLGVRP